MIGLLHLATLLGCSTTEIRYISHSGNLPANTTASQIFYGVDIVYYPMIYGVFAFVIAIVFGVIFAYAYKRLPGLRSSTKGVTIGAFLFVFVAFAGPGYFTDYSCSSGPLPVTPYATFILSIPAALFFGYLLGSFYDSFGRLEIEETEERRKMKESVHWSELFKSKLRPDNNEEESTEENDAKET
jgi:hypothetical protein